MLRIEDINQTKILIKCSSDPLKLPALTDYGHMIK